MEISRLLLSLPFKLGWDDLIAGVILVVGLLGFFNGPIPYVSGLTDFYHQIRAELIGIGVSVLIIANANEVVKKREAKELLILQMGSPNSAFAVEATRQLSERGWLSDGSLRGAYLSRTNLREADLAFANLCDAALYSANLAGATLFGANLSGAKLDHANISSADIHEADLIGTDLHKANLRLADLEYANLKGANLSEADLRETNLLGTNLDEANLSGAVLVEAIYNYETQWPAGFDPEAAGAILAEPPSGN